MAELIEGEVQEVGELEAVEQQQATQAAEQRQQVTESKVEDEIPEEFRGKSIKDLVGMTIHARKEMGRQANEVGEIRKLADELIKSQLKSKQPEPEPQREVDFFENPQEAIRRAVATNPEVQQAKQYALMAQQEQAKLKLQQLHPDYQQLVADQEFATWVQQSPIRTNLIQQANAYNVAAAHELFSTYKELRQAKQQRQVQQITETEKVSRDSSLKAAAVDTGGSGESGRKVYRRADLIRLKMTDPAKYDSMNDEILAAYAEGRVK